MPFDPLAPPLSGRTLTRQLWADLTFLHWPVPAAAIAGLFPPGTRPDEFGGTSYVGLVPFRMRGAGPGTISVPYFGSFCETNVRLYSVDDADRHGIVFRTLDADRLAPVLLARALLRLPYAWSSMSLRRTGDEVTYRSIRRGPDRRKRPGTLIRVRPGARTTPTEVEAWLTARWGLHTAVAGRTVWVPNEHLSWPLYSADLLALDEDLVAACGVDIAAATMMRPLWSPGVRTTFGRPVPLDGMRR